MERRASEIIDQAKVRRAYDAYIADCRSRNLAESTITSYEKTLEHFTAFCSLKSVSPIEECDLAMFSDFRSSRRVAGSTGRKELETLKR